MNFIHYTINFDEKVEEVRKNHIFKKIEDLRYIDNPGTLNSIDSYTKGIFVLKLHGELTCRIIIQSEWITIGNEKVHVYFIREYVSKKGFDYYWGSVIHPQLRSGEWVNLYPLSEKEKENFRNDYLKAFELKENQKLPLPEYLTDWLIGFKINLDFDIYEREDWVLYSNDRSFKGLQEKHIIFFRDTIKGIINNDENSKVIVTEINSKNKIYTAIYDPFNIGIIYGEYFDNAKRRIVLYNGANLKEQSDRWKQAIENVNSENDDVNNSVLNISKNAFRAYPKWIVTNDDEELWIAIQRFDGSHNLSLLPEQVDFLNNFQFPAYINGQAGSGKSTMLYYLFSNVYFYKCAEEGIGDIIFLTENDTLLEYTCKSIIGLLSDNPEFNAGLSIEDRNNVRNYFSSFLNYLIGILPEDVKSNYLNEKYLDFARFKEKFNNKFPNRKNSAEEVWFVISTYVYGYYENVNIDTVEKYVNDKQGIPSKFRIVDQDNFNQIVTTYLSFYNKLLEEGWWDKITLVRRIREFYPGPLPKQYTVVFCDEAQDFSRIELRLIIQSSEFIKYDLKNVEQVPIVFAGDALQTVSPTGFSEARLHQMYYEAFDDANFEYNKSRSTYNPEYNYRSLKPIVRLANIIQNYRKEGLKEDGAIKQIAKRDKFATLPILHTKEWLLQNENRILFEKKFKYKSFIVPVDLNEEGDYVKNQELLFETFADIKSSIDAKGAEYSQVVVYGFGDYYVKEFGHLKWNTEQSNFKIKFFFNKLYVALTRAQNELTIIDGFEGCEYFWKELLNIPREIDKWEDYTDITEIMLISPQTGLRDIQDSTPDEALNNAIIDMEQGISDKNVARLIVASNVFLILGKVEEANNCLGYKEAIKWQWNSAGEHFLKAKNLEEASNAFFQAKNWDQLLKSATKSLPGHKQEVRFLIAGLMQNNSWERQNISKIYELRNVLIDVLKDVNWLADFFEKLKNIIALSTSQEVKRELAFILESLLTEKDIDLWDLLGNLYFDTKQFNYAIDAWSRVVNLENSTSYPPNYILAHIERSKDESNLLEETLWSGRIISTDIDQNARLSFSKKVLERKEQLQLDYNSSIQYELLSNSLLASSIIGELNTAVEVAKQIELISDKFNSIALLYSNSLKYCSNNELAIFLKERWAKLKSREYGLERNADANTILLKINEEFKNLKFPFEDSNISWTIDEIMEIPENPEPLNLEPNFHIKNFRITGFRKFDDIEVQNIGQFNLILGDNNSGKTTILEALLFNPEPNQCFLNLLYARKQRNNNADKETDYNFLESLINRRKGSPTINFIFKEGRRFWSYKLRYPSIKELHHKLEIEKLDTKNYLLIETGINKIEISDSVEEINNNLIDPQKLSSIPYVPFGKGYSEKMTSVFHSEIASKRMLMAQFIDQMKTFIPNIVGLAIDPDSDSIKVEEEIDGNDYGSSLNDFGEGANKLFRILVQLHAAKNKRLMVDEIDAGIHYSRFKLFWKVILKTAHDYNVQLFATTHNEECIKFFWEVLQEEEFISYRKESRIITLDNNLKTGNVITIVRDYNNMLFSNEHNLEMRGGEI